MLFAVAKLLVVFDLVSCTMLAASLLLTLCTDEYLHVMMPYQ